MRYIPLRLRLLLLVAPMLVFTNPAQADCNPLLPRETPDSDFVIHPGGDTVSHPRTGLTWRRCQLGMDWNGSTCTGIAQDLVWRSALLAVETMNQGAGLGGQRDWRLPDLNELMTLVDHACYDPAINESIFPNTAYPTPTSDVFWSATPDGSVGTGWGVRFQKGSITFWSLNDNTLRVRPVRGTLSGTLGGGLQPPSLPSFVEDFDDIDEINAHGWLAGNMSEPLGDGVWGHGDDSVFPAQSGASTSFVFTNYQATGDNGTISNWLLTPLLDFRSGSTVSFWTRTVSGATYPDRLQVRVCLGDPCNTVGPGAAGVSGFTNLLVDINPDLLAGPDDSGVNGYPDQWARFVLGASDGVPQAGRGRIAFRYFVEDAGLLGTNSDYIGLDSVRINAAPLP